MLARLNMCSDGVPELRGLAMARLTGPDMRSIGTRPFVSSSTNEAPASMSTPATARCPKCRALCKLLHPDSPSYPGKDTSDLNKNDYLFCKLLKWRNHVINKDIIVRDTSGTHRSKSTKLENQRGISTELRSSTR